jgi:hypothetical protein
MSQSAYNSLALHEILLSIANSLNEAQHQLRNMPPYDEYGRPNTIYQLPYLDFNLEVISQFESTESVITDNSITGGIEKKSIVTGETGKTTLLQSKETFAQNTSLNAIRFVPFRSTETNTKNVETITSTISGRFVAIMPNEGLAQIFLSCTTEFISIGSQHVDYSLTVKIQQANNDPVIGQRVEVNFDEFTSLGFNSQVAVSLPTFLNAKDGYTNNNGEFSVQVRMNVADYNSGKTFVYVANSGTQFSSIAISKN